MQYGYEVWCNGATLADDGLIYNDLVDAIAVGKTRMKDVSYSAGDNKIILKIVNSHEQCAVVCEMRNIPIQDLSWHSTR